MSKNNFIYPKSGQRGFCNAIFSTSVFDKENTAPYNDLSTSKNSTSTSPQCKKNLYYFLPPKEVEDDSVENVLVENPTKASSRHPQSLPRSHSSSTLNNQDSNNIKKFMSEETLKTKCSSVSRLSGEKAQVTHFCTPKSILESKAGSTKKTVKRFFSDNNLPQTPDCYNSVHLETPRSKTDLAFDEQTVYDGENSNLTVGIRVRPLSIKEKNEPKITSIVQVNNQNITVNCDLSQHTFMYDHCYQSYDDPSTPGHASQELLFNSMVLPLVQNAFEGYNVCLFAYGQTGSGKSYSMMGAESGQNHFREINADSGIIPRFCNELFSRISQYEKENISVEISYFEIYNEKIHDLLVTNNNGHNNSKRPPLKVREHPALGPYVVDLSQHCVRNYNDLKAWLKVGNSQRATAATGMNEKSSRSHSIFSIILTRDKSKENSDIKNVDTTCRSKINLVDLAGSERLSNTCASGDRLREGVSINKSLLTLGKVIGCLAENTNNRKRGFVPYRESVLTWLLKESLGGNSKTAMLGTVSPANIHLEETLATLRYACQARAIVNRVRINEDPHDRLIRQLKAEVQRLKSMRDSYEKQLGLTSRRILDTTDSSSDCSDDAASKQKEIDQLKQQLRKMEEQLSNSQKTWQEKLRDAEEKKKSELAYLRRCGIAIELDFSEKIQQPCLVNLAADPMLSGTLLYLIPAGRVNIGKFSRASSCTKNVQIILDGPLVKDHHCTIENDQGELTLHPFKDAECFVNGQLVFSKVRLKHGDRLVIGGNHYFKVCNPQDSQGNGEVSGQAIDFEFAYQEILRIQEEKLRAELEESKKKAMKELENAKKEVELQLDNQKNNYEREIKKLGSSIEEQKRALDEMNRKKRELEHEKELLATEIETNNKIRKLESQESNCQISPYKTNFLQDLEQILNETTADVKTALSIQTSIEAMKTGGVSLHEIQLLVREANERCKEVGVHYEFHQQQIVVNKGLQPIIRVRDKDTMRESFWQPMRFLDWIHKLREHELESSIKELQDPNDKWEPFEDSNIVQDSLCTSRISVNITPVKKQLNESLGQFSLDGSFLDSSTADQTTESVLQRRRDDIHQCLIQMEIASKTLKGLCHQYESREVSGKVTQALDKVNVIINGLKDTLDEKSKFELVNSSENLINSNIENNSVDYSEKNETNTFLNKTDSKLHSPNLAAEPEKSTLKNKCVFLKNDIESRSVRFNIKK